MTDEHPSNANRVQEKEPWKPTSQSPPFPLLRAMQVRFRPELTAPTEEQPTRVGPGLLLSGPLAVWRLRCRYPQGEKKGLLGDESSEPIWSEPKATTGKALAG